jgi:Kef-type K+ transport system membrane component KefB
MNEPGGARTAAPSLRFSRRAAFAVGVFAFVVESWRRRHQFGDVAIWPLIFDDYIAGSFLIAASRIAARDTGRGPVWLAAAWGASAMMMYGSFFGQLINRAAPDASGLPTVFVLAVKAVLFAVCLACLVVTLRSGAAPRASSGSGRE